MPAAPPVMRLPVTAPLELDIAMTPEAVFSPTRPPTIALPATLPENEQRRISPAFRPARPPAASQEEEAFTVPLTFKFSILAPSCTRWKRPASDNPSLRLRPLMV